MSDKRTRGRPPIGDVRTRTPIRLNHRERGSLETAAFRVRMPYTTWLRTLGVAAATGDYPPAVASWLRRLQLAPKKAA